MMTDREPMGEHGAGKPAMLERRMTTYFLNIKLIKSCSCPAVVRVHREKEWWSC